MAKHIYKKWCTPRPNDDILNRYGILINNINMMKRKCCCMKFTIPFHIFLLLLVSCGCMNWFAACMMRIWCICLQRYVFLVISYKTIICITFAAIISYACCAYADKQCLLKLNNINPMLLLVCCGKSTKIFHVRIAISIASPGQFANFGWFVGTNCQSCHGQSCTVYDMVDVSMSHTIISSKCFTESSSCGKCFSVS